MYAVDLEWGIGTPAGQVPDLVSVAWANDTGSDIGTVHDRSKILSAVRAALSTRYIGANVPQDLAILARFEPALLPEILDAYRGNRISDVLTRQKRIDIASGASRYKYSLGTVAEAHGLTVDKSDPWRLRYGELTGVPIEEWPPEAVHYARTDAVVTWQVYQAQSIAEHAHTGEGDHARAHWVLYLHQLRGIDTDPVWVAELEKQFDAAIADYQRQCIDAGLARVEGKKNPRIVRNTKAVREHAERLGVTLRTESGLTSVSAEALAGLSIPNDDPIWAYVGLGSLQSNREKNLTALKHPVVRTRYNELLDTGRISSSAPNDADGAGTNLQNLPRPDPDAKRLSTRLIGRFRGALVPPSGHMFLICDYSGAELAAFADVEMAWFGSSRFGEVMHSGRNPHTMFGCTLLGIDYSQYDPTNKQHKQMRQVAKAWNFGKLGGMGDQRFRDHLRTTSGIVLEERTVREYSRSWKQLWGVQRYFDRMDLYRQPSNRYTIEAPRTCFVRGGMSFTKACNFPFQHLAAIAIKRALWDLFEATLKPGPLQGAWSCLTVHDEIIMCARTAVAEAALEQQKQIMIASFRSVCPTAPISVDGWAANRYAKG